MKTIIAVLVAAAIGAGVGYQYGKGKGKPPEPTTQEAKATECPPPVPVPGQAPAQDGKAPAALQQASLSEDDKNMERAKAAVIGTMIDPESVRFRSLTIRGNFVCGEVNGKNQMGGYTGFQTFLVQLNPEPVVLHQDPTGELIRAACIEKVGVAP